MNHSFCPGARILRQPVPEAMACPACGREVEIWSDELRATCPQCGKIVMKDGAMACLDWCTMGKECVGDEAYDRYKANRAVTMREKLLAELEEWFGSDQKRIDHAKEVLCFAEDLLRRESGDWHIVVPASILHDVGIKVAQEKYGSVAGRYQEVEGPPVARRILLKLGLRLQDIEEICAIIAHHHSPTDSETQNFRLLYDADCLVNMREVLAQQPAEQRAATVDKIFLTAAGKEVAMGLQPRQPK